jgi:hypothetical protein
MTNTAARSDPLTEVPLRQWAFVECRMLLRGGEVINYIDDEGIPHRADGNQKIPRFTR